MYPDHSYPVYKIVRSSVYPNIGKAGIFAGCFSPNDPSCAFFESQGIVCKRITIASGNESDNAIFYEYFCQAMNNQTIFPPDCNYLTRNGSAFKRYWFNEYHRSWFDAWVHTVSVSFDSNRFPFCQK